MATSPTVCLLLCAILSYSLSCQAQFDQRGGTSIQISNVNTNNVDCNSCRNPSPSPSPSPSPQPDVELLYAKYSTEDGGPNFVYTITDPTIRRVSIVLCGAGGGGGAGYADSTYGGGGGGGACYLNRTIASVKVGDVIEGSIGFGGSPGCVDLTDSQNNGDDGTISALRFNGNQILVAFAGGGGGGVAQFCSIMYSGGGGGGGGGGSGGYATCADRDNTGPGGPSRPPLPSGGDGAYVSSDYVYIPPGNGTCINLQDGSVFCSGAGGGGAYGTDGGSVRSMRGGRGNGSVNSPGGGGGGASALSRGDDASGNYFSIGSGGGGSTSDDIEACGKSGGDGAVQIYGYRTD